jgi:hypothetical protein
MKGVTDIPVIGHYELVGKTAELMWRGLKQGVKMNCYHQQPCQRKCPDDSSAFGLMPLNCLDFFSV